MIIQIHNLNSFRPLEQDKIRSACNKGQPVLDWGVWEQKIANFDYTENKGKNGWQILQMIKLGTDGVDKAPDGDIDIDMEGFHSFSNTVGYTYLGTWKTWMNRRYLGLFTEAEIFGHIMHELMHRAFLFKHANRWQRYTSVPYKVGYISRDCFKHFYETRDIETLLDMSMKPMIKSKLEIRIC